MKRVLVLLFSLFTLGASAQLNNGNYRSASNSGNHIVKFIDETDGGTSGDAFNPGDVFGDPDAPTEVPFDDYIPFLVAGAIVYCVWANRQSKALPA